LAEESLQSALNLLERLGLEMEVVGCELYNSIAQMMIMKYRHWMSNKKRRSKEIAEEWVNTEEGKLATKNQMKSIKKQFDYTSKPISKGN
jgi:hypothetical protein